MEWKEIIAKMKEKRPDKTGWIILVLFGVLLLVIAFPTGEKIGTKQDKTTEKAKTVKQPVVAVETDQEKQLANMLSGVEGVGRVRVMITYKDSGTQVVEKDGNSTLNHSTEDDKSGGTRKTQESQKQETTVYNKSSSDGAPFVAKELTPEIEGILVVAEGGDRAVVKQNISNAVLALFPVEAHKIVVVKMNLQEGGN
jgi:stage III sporulation protein AG